MPSVEQGPSTWPACAEWAESRLLVIGGGAVAEAMHLPAVLAVLGTEKVRLAEPDEPRRRTLQEKFGVPAAAADFRDLLADSDAALVLTPPHLHESVTVDCLRAGLHVLCEKPLANTASAGRRMIEEAVRAGKLLASGHNYRFFPNRSWVRDRIKDGEFGPDVFVEITEGSPADWPALTGYMFRKELVPGGVMLNNGVHSLDFLLWCLGDSVEEEYRDDSIGGLESNAVLELRFAEGATARLRISRTRNLANQIRVVGDGQSVTLPAGHMNQVIHADGSIEIKSAVQSRQVNDWPSLGRAQIVDFLAAAATATPPRADGQAGLKVVELIERCYLQKTSRQRLPKAPVPGWMW
jgi:predicted dehydrogenase